MKTLLLYDEASKNFNGVNLVEEVTSSLNSKGFTTKLRKIIDSEFKPCIGCFGCWVKTPGLCVLQGDEANEINNYVINSQLLVILTQIQYGSYSKDIKKYLDRQIPNISPFFTIIKGETHHQKRYNSYPCFVGIGYSTNVSETEEKTFKTLVKRNSINLHTPKSLSLVIGNEKDVSKEMTELSNFLVEVSS
ncbi:hypothetical protein CLHOM_29940 [Clostridium homopropionicum DSM 5847]|uniref:NADPH-dependent FMN reductase n=1 Tax=Clostridium homopropionicum DSM 5847 TaxID=1121318 RepID=A0A0L6Z6X8_9CLOT|nr:flavodoxin family protein [Clostridium homopropionicum]KOA18710.1 hypothetical protein CLHOM_29940 [Clostridium homopropionicum DSM 5847]SFG53449.1 hypothetical protein SAMN04488501_110131 [Clostridium homopropionicum]